MIDPTVITPTVEQVAKYIRTRTLDVNNNVVGTFTADTQPTATGAAAHASSAAAYVALRASRVAREVPAGLAAAGADAAAVYAALTIEQSYYTEGSAPDDTGVDQLGRMAREKINAFIAALPRTLGVRVPSIVSDEAA